MDAINTLTVYMIILFIITAHIRVIDTPQAKERRLFRKPAFLKATKIFFKICVNMMELLPITTLIGATHVPPQDNERHQLERADQIPISSWYIGKHKEQLQSLPSYTMTLTS